jgi:hypothetical protein
LDRSVASIKYQVAASPQLVQVFLSAGFCDFSKMTDYFVIAAVAVAKLVFGFSWHP